MAGPLSILEPGRLGYAAASALQADLVRRRQAGEIPDTLVLLEHPPVITLGRNAKAEHVLKRREGVEVVECDRGGDVTFHGPGQLVGYPIFDLRACPRPAFLPPRSGRLELGPVDFVRALEEALIRACGEAGVASGRIAGLTGVWTEAEPRCKLAAIGIHVARGVTSHGFALNVANDLSGFAMIVPCGIADRGVTSLSRASGRAWTVGAAATLVRRHMLAVFDREWDDSRHAG